MQENGSSGNTDIFVAIEMVKLGGYFLFYFLMPVLKQR
jgi:hypothetical protein